MLPNSEGSSKAVLIAGGTGFIGSRLVDHLAGLGYQCSVLTRNPPPSRPGVKYIRADLGTLLPSEAARIVETCGPFASAAYLAANIPLAGAPKEGYTDAVSSTLVPFVRFIEGFGSSLSRIVYCSSVDVVGIPDSGVYDEAVLPRPRTPYGVAKLAGESYLASLALAHKFTAVTLRFSQVYGPNEPAVRVIPILLKALRDGRPFSLYGTGQERRKFLYIDDAVQAVVLALASSVEGILNIAGPEASSILDLVRMAQEQFGRTLELQHKSAPPLWDNLPDIGKAQQALGYLPRFGLAEGLRQIEKAEHNE